MDHIFEQATHAAKTPELVEFVEDVVPDLIEPYDIVADSDKRFIESTLLTCLDNLPPQSRYAGAVYLHDVTSNLNWDHYTDSVLQRAVDYLETSGLPMIFRGAATVELYEACPNDKPDLRTRIVEKMELFHDAMAPNNQRLFFSLLLHADNLPRPAREEIEERIDGIPFHVNTLSN